MKASSFRELGFSCRIKLIPARDYDDYQSWRVTIRRFHGPDCHLYSEHYHGHWECHCPRPRFATFSVPYCVVKDYRKPDLDVFAWCRKAHHRSDLTLKISKIIPRWLESEEMSHEE